MTDNISLVILRGAELEKILKNKFGAEGSGLGQRLRSVESRLAPELTKKLWWIVGIRNDAAHEPESFQLHDSERFIRTCDEAKAMLDAMEVSERFPAGLDSYKTKFSKGSSSESNSSKSNRKNPADQNNFKSISPLFYLGIIMALAVQFSRANAWSLPLFKSYEYAFATAFFLTACGVAHTALIWQNIYVGFGIFLSTIGGFAWKYKWILPVVKTYDVPLYFGILLILYGTVPQFPGAILAIVGSSFLAVEMWLAFTKGLTAIHSGNLVFAAILIGLSVLMFRRHKKLRETGVFRKKPNNF